MEYEWSRASRFRKHGTVRKLVITVVLCYLATGMAEGQRRRPCSQGRQTYTRTITVPIPRCHRPVSRPASRRRVPLSTMSLGKQTANQIKKTFPGLFYTQEEVDKLQISPGTRSVDRKLSHDGDLHCPTHRYVERAPNTALNTEKKMRTIVHMHDEEVYQFFHKGTCVKVGGPGSQCSGGSCFQQKSVVYMLVYDDDNPSWPVKFDSFEVDTYCSCQRIF